jgi:hypothetical protein
MVALRTELLMFPSVPKGTDQQVVAFSPKIPPLDRRRKGICITQNVESKQGQTNNH